MSALDSVEAQETAIRALRRAREQGRVASAYLFVGPSGVGKELTAVSFATDVIAGRDERVAARISAGNHPDVRVFGPREEGKRNIQVEVLRNEILPLAQYAPFEAQAAFFIFPQADVSFPDFQPEAANALLKTLEEPRPNVHFILTTERPDSLLPTIRSRCQRIRFGRLPDAVLQRILEAREIPQSSIGPAVALSAGRADVALALATGDTVQELDALMREVDETVGRGGPGALVDLAEKLARRDDLDLALLTLQAYYRDAAVSALGVPASAWSFSRNGEDAAAQGLPPVEAGTAAARVSLIHDCVRAMQQNANRQVAVDALLFGLRKLR